MFSLERTTFGITTPVSMIYINETNVEHEEPDVTLTAETAAETLELSGLTGSARFHDGSTEYTAPFQGSDFLGGVSGTLYVTITETLAAGIYEAALREPKDLYGICGWGLCGMIQGGNMTEIIYDVGIILRVQSLPIDWRTAASQASLQYAVPTVTK